MPLQDEVLNLSQAEQILADRKSGKVKLYDMKDGRLTVDHARTANAMVMFIANVPMDPWIQKIMIMRLGAPFLNKHQMTPLSIALRLGMKESEVIEIEEEGKKICSDYMERVTGTMLMPHHTGKRIITDAFNDTV